MCIRGILCYSSVQVRLAYDKQQRLRLTATIGDDWRQNGQRCRRQHVTDNVEDLSSFLSHISHLSLSLCQKMPVEWLFFGLTKHSDCWWWWCFRPMGFTIIGPAAVGTALTGLNVLQSEFWSLSTQQGSTQSPLELGSRLGLRRAGQGDVRAWAVEWGWRFHCDYCTIWAICN